MPATEPICRYVYEGEHLALQVLDRDSARVCAHDTPFALISISDPNQPPPRLAPAPNRRGVLTLAFSDMDERSSRRPLPPGYLSPFSPDMARQIADFVRDQTAQGVRLIVVHCVAGMSRSAGVASALSQFYNHDETFFLVHYLPNTFVRGLVLEALTASEL